MKKLFSFLVLLVAALVFTACGKNDEKETVDFGMLGPFTGSLSQYGEPARKGVALAVEEINAAGGILGKQVVLHDEDDEGDAQKALNAYNKLVDSIDFLIGEITSGTSEVIAAEAQKDGLPMLTPSATAAGVTLNRSYVFRVCFLDPDQGVSMANFASETLKVTKVAVAYDNSDDYSKGVAAAFKAQAEANGMTVVFYDGGVVADSADYKALATKIKNSDAQAVFIPVYAGSIATLTKDVRAAGYTLPLLGADGWDGASTILAGEDGEGDVTPLNNTYFSNHYAADEVNAKAFVAAYKAKYNETPNAFAALGYDAAYLAKAAIEKAGTTDKAAVAAALAQVTYLGVTGEFTYNETGNPVKKIVICQYIDGKVTFKESK
ncbi:MAG: ABC transporter substrate-binding protein [Bacilli bacterium]|jgi:branched-chain amino acid transport system substrate-binding protein|nr:ABC transporter substrate-binding protein [Bacilli bacterium]MDD3348134.1 ABC transporter substrate-binding protein [Bacilli bacterium]MDD4056071.1 ABC transporter substrate-binding protein [Bacilli bacterium]MDY0209640.1 ABC transporter substrate-binding protein [Bacilli bacterium]